MNSIRRELVRLGVEREAVVAATNDGAKCEERHEIVAQTLDFGAQAKELQGRALRDLVR